MRRGAGIPSLLLALGALAGCATAPAAPLTVDDVVAERLAAIEAAERERFDAFVAGSSARLDELGLPLPEFEGLVALDDWDSAVTGCIERLDPQVDVTRLEGGFSVNYFGVVGESYERIRWTIESCNARYGIADLRAQSAAGVVEAAWRYQDATQRVLPCLRSLGATVPSPPSRVAYIEHLGTGREWSPYAMLGLDPAGLVQAAALCPPSSTLIDERIARAIDGAAP
ncbi:hypothetical protein [Microcella sp.]|uniref:hypothetical protein n=1 Tax=Microcella sp. TaxID=1913979 RepID=UPI0039192EB0